MLPCGGIGIITENLFLPLQQNQESHQYQIEACLDEIFATRSSDSPVL